MVLNYVLLEEVNGCSDICLNIFGREVEMKMFNMNVLLEE